MNPDSRNRVPGSSADKKRRFGRRKKRQKVFNRRMQQVSSLTANPSAESSRTQQQSAIPSAATRTMPDTLSSTSSAKTARIIVEAPTSHTLSAQYTTPKLPPSRSRQKLKSAYVDPGPIQNRIFDISLLLPGLQEFLACKACGGNVNFSEVDIRGLGSKLSITCTVCNKAAFIDSSRKVSMKGNAYEINRRIVLAMRSLGHGHTGLSTLCGQMDFLPPVSHSNFDIINQNLKIASENVAQESMRAAMQEDCSSESQEDDRETVSGDGSWRKRGHSSLQGVSTLIRNANGKVIDVAPKQSFCKACQMHPEEDTEAYREWFEAHENKCSANHEGSSGKMEVDGIVEMFQRSESMHGVKYKNYIGDGDSKVFKALCVAKPYGDNFTILKKECIGHVQKRMGTRLRKLKKSLSNQKLSDGKGIGGKDRLTAQRIDQLTRYYGNAIRGHNQSAVEMSNAIWATFYHKRSTDEKPTHHLCPPGNKSWCKWQVAKARNQLKNFHHKDTFPAAIMDVIQPIYQDLTRTDLLERCIGGFTQNNNESFNQSIWKLVPKHSFSGLIVLEIGVNMAVSCFNDGKAGILEVMKKFSVRPGSSAVNWAKNADEQRQLQSDRRTAESTLGAHQARRKRSRSDDDFYSAGAF